MELWDLLEKQHKGDLSYAEGVVLFVSISPRSPLVSFFKVEDRHSRKKLKALLEEKYQELLRNRTENNFIGFGVASRKNKPINLEILPAELRKEYSRLSPLIRQISSLHARLYNCSTDAQRYKIARELIGLVADRRAIFYRVDSFLETGTDPQAIVLSKPEPIRPGLEKNFQVEYELKLLRAQRSRLKDNPRRAVEYKEIIQKIKELESKRYV